MNYADTTNWMFNKFPMYQKIGAKAYKPDLGNIKELLDFLGNPQNSFKTVHVAGTNGKGTVSQHVYLPEDDAAVVRASQPVALHSP